MNYFPKQIVDACCIVTGVKLADLYGDGRMPKVVAARQIAAGALRVLCGISYPEIAAHLGRTNHAAPWTAARRFMRSHTKNRWLERIEAQVQKLPQTHPKVIGWRRLEVRMHCAAIKEIFKLHPETWSEGHDRDWMVREWKRKVAVRRYYEAYFNPQIADRRRA